MILVRKVDGDWRELGAAPTTLQQQVSTCERHYHDGRIERDVPCEPYPITVTVDPGKVARLVADGVWGDAELGALGLKVAQRFAVPEGKIAVGAARFVEDGDVVRQMFDTEDAPPPPPEPTLEQRVDRMLGDYGLTRDELLSVLSGEKRV